VPQVPAALFRKPINTVCCQRSRPAQSQNPVRPDRQAKEDETSISQVYRGRSRCRDVFIVRVFPSLHHCRSPSEKRHRGHDYSKRVNPPLCFARPCRHKSNSSTCKESEPMSDRVVSLRRHFHLTEDEAAFDKTLGRLPETPSSETVEARKPGNTKWQ